MPTVAAVLIIFGLILPSFLLYEPQDSPETISLKLAIIVCIAVFGTTTAVLRILGSWWRTRRLISEWSRNSVPIEIGSLTLPVFKLRHSFPVFAVVGVFRPRLFIAEQVLSTLDENEIEAVIQHELGHIAARDNLKRLLMKLAGDLNVFPIGGSLERGWNEVAEAAADEYAVDNSGRQTALNLAGALIKIARIIPDQPVPRMPAVSYAVMSGEALTGRIRRLLRLAEGSDLNNGKRPSLSVPVVIFIFLILTIVAMDHASLEKVHSITETVLATLQ